MHFYGTKSIKLLLLINKTAASGGVTQTTCQNIMIKNVLNTILMLWKASLFAHSKRYN
jgi:hypothetical protein